MDTVLEFEKEINRWLKFMWQKADYISEMPTMSELTRHMALQLDLWAGNNQDSFINAVNQQRKEKGIPETFANIQVQTQMGVISNMQEDGSMQIRVVSGYKTNHEQLLLTFGCVKKDLEIDGEKATAIKSISLVNGNGSHLSLMDLALRAQELETGACGTDLNKRWMLALEHFRVEHPICPKCQREIRLYGGSGPRPMTCDGCDWTSRRKYSYLSEMADGTNFQREVAAVAKDEAFSSQMEQALSDLDKAIQTALTAFEGRGKVDPELEQKFRKLLEERFQKATQKLGE